MPRGTYGERTPIEVCYACDRAATSREHVPPDCLFPKASATGGRDLRRNLIKVPSCNEHNAGKSLDDEYLRLVLSVNICGNEFARRNAETKVARSVLRSDALTQLFLSDLPDVDVVDSATGRVHEGTLFPLDRPRLLRCLEAIARGLFLHHHGYRWLDEIRVHCDFLPATDGPARAQDEERRRVLFDAANARFANADRHGENPEVFWYQAVDDGGRFTMRLGFYGSCRVTVVFVPCTMGGNYQMLVR
jgi:hypothetical protein